MATMCIYQSGQDCDQFMQPLIEHVVLGVALAGALLLVICHLWISGRQWLPGCVATVMILFHLCRLFVGAKPWPMP